MLETCAFKSDEPKYFPDADAFNSQKKTYAIDNNQLLERIVLNPKVMVGKPIIQGTRLTVQYILGLLAHGANVTEILGEHEGLNQEDILACLLLESNASALGILESNASALAI